jgi:23S rRNA (uracil1939-C5)-methyltransferase
MPPAFHRTLKRGDTVELTINTVAFGGAGVGRHGDMVVFVPFTVDGDTVSVEIVDTKKRFVTAELKSIHNPSPHRTIPRCEAFTRCGACTYQHIAYEHQLVLKKLHVREALERIGRFDRISLEDTIPSPRTYGYRGKADVHIVAERERVPSIGFAARATHRIVDIERCEIVHESINRTLSLLKKERPPTGRIPLWSGPAELVSKSCIVRQVKGRNMLVPLNGFFQANLYLTDILVNIVMEFCNLSGTETVLDGFCGAGLFSLFLAPFCECLYGIDVESESIRCAEDNLKKAGITTAIFEIGDMARILRNRFINKNIRIDLALVDPPRIGLEPDTVEALGILAPRKIVYVSCNPATLARDLRTLAGFGYDVRRVQSLDMFPQTCHIETVVLLQRALSAFHEQEDKPD